MSPKPSVASAGVVVAAVLALPGSAFATNTVPVTVCASIDHTLRDVQSKVPELDDDYILDRSVRAAAGVKVELVDNFDPANPIELWMPDTDLEEASACFPMAILLNTEHTYQVKVWGTASIDGNTVLVKDPSGDDLVFVEDSAWSPVAGEHGITVRAGDEWNLLVVGITALHRRTAGVGGETFEFWPTLCPTALDASCFDPSTERIYINPIGADGPFDPTYPTHLQLKQVIAHELGHAIAYALDAHSPAATAVLLEPDGNCIDTFGPWVRKQYTSKAASEGLANYYAAVVFNEPGGATCELYRGFEDFNQDFVKGNGNETTPSCEGNPALEDWAAEDYLLHECVGVLEDRGTILDWTRAFWDFGQQPGVSTEDVFAMWDLANPRNWDADGGGSTSDDPEERLAAAAATLGLSAEWAAAASVNGVR